jgi:hypothetical protein
MFIKIDLDKGMVDMAEEKKFIPIGFFDLSGYEKVDPLAAELNYLNLILESVVDSSVRDKFLIQIKKTASANTPKDQKVSDLIVIEKTIQRHLRTQIPLGKFGQSRNSVKIRTVMLAAMKELANPLQKNCHKEIARLFSIIEDEVEKSFRRKEVRLLMIVRNNLIKMEKAAHSRTYQSMQDQNRTILLLKNASSSIHKMIVMCSPIKKR